METRIAKNTRDFEIFQACTSLIQFHTASNVNFQSLLKKNETLSTPRRVTQTCQKKEWRGELVLPLYESTKTVVKWRAIRVPIYRILVLEKS